MMARIKGRDTAPERAVRSVIHLLGYRFRLHRKDLPGRPDIVLPRLHLVVFVHGCFWHRHQGCTNCTTPTTNRAFWLAKFKANVERDARNQRALRRSGWRVVTIWECETEAPDRLRRRVSAVLDRATGTHGMPHSRTHGHGTSVFDHHHPRYTSTTFSTSSP
jgi:DNA mismatch endonuclease (patch repair protein)